MEKILNQTYLLIDEIKNTNEYKTLIKLNSLILTKYRDEIKEYTKTFNIFNEAFKIGKDYYPNFKEVANNYSKAKTNLYEKEEVKKYFELENKINDKLDIISKELIKAVSNYSEVKGAICQWK